MMNGYLPIYKFFTTRSACTHVEAMETDRKGGMRGRRSIPRRHRDSDGAPTSRTCSTANTPATNPTSDRNPPIAVNLYAPFLLAPGAAQVTRRTIGRASRDQHGDRARRDRQTSERCSRIVRERMSRYQRELIGVPMNFIRIFLSFQFYFWKNVPSN